MVSVPKLAAFTMLLLLSLSFAENFVAINSHDGRDVLSGVFYANAKGLPVAFLPSTGSQSSGEVFARKVGADKSVLLIQSTTNPISGFVESELRAKGNTVSLLASSDAAQTNLDLASRSGATSFIIVDSAYSDSAVSVIPYAAATKSYVILADKSNIDEIKPIVAGKKVIIYGLVDKAVKDGLASNSPTTIGKGEDKYADNIELANLLMGTYGASSPAMNRPIITDGSVLEDSLASGQSPVLLSGRLVPQVTYNFIKDKARSNKLGGVYLIGNDLVSPVYDMRERIKNELKQEGLDRNFGIMIKFAQGTTDLGVLGLDLFKLPAYKPSLKITEIVYNKETGKVMVGLENTGDGALYFNMELKIRVNGEDFRVFGEKDAQLIERGESAGLQYDLDLSNVTEGDLTASVLVKYGSSRNSLEEFQAVNQALQSISYTDNSNVTVKFAKYDKKNQMLRITIKNNGDKTAYAFTKVTLVDESGVPTKISAAATREIEPYSIFVEEIPLIMSDKEIEINKDITVAVDYGGRRSFLVKKAVYTVPLEQESLLGGNPDTQTMLIGIIALLVLAIVIYALYQWFVVGKRKKKKEDGKEG